MAVVNKLQIEVNKNEENRPVHYRVKQTLLPQYSIVANPIELKFFFELFVRGTSYIKKLKKY